MSMPESFVFTVKNISMYLKEGRDTIYSTISELEKKGYCTKSEKRDELGRVGGVYYMMYEQPFTENPFTENPEVDKPFTDFQEVDRVSDTQAVMLQNNSQYDIFSSFFNETKEKTEKEDEKETEKEKENSPIYIYNIPLKEKEKEKEKAEEKEKKEKLHVISQKFVHFWNEHNGVLSKVRVVSPNIEKGVSKLLQNVSILDIQKTILLVAALPSFYFGDNDRKWNASFMWLIKNTNDNFYALLNGSIIDEKFRREYEMIMECDDIEKACNVKIDNKYFSYKSITSQYNTSKDDEWQ